MRILFSGGGTLGSVMPLLAVYEALKTHCEKKGESLRVEWVGSRRGPEREVVARAGIPFTSVATGKLRRYFSWRNFIDPLLLVLGLIQSFFIVIRFRPSIIINAGSFVGVPVIAAGWALGRRCLIFQPDLHPILSNRVTARFASRICVALDEEKIFFPRSRTVVTGIPVRVRDDSALIGAIRKRWNIQETERVITITGGGTGAHDLNILVWQSLPVLIPYAHIIHITGAHKFGHSADMAETYSRYHPVEFTADESAAYEKMATIVVTRSGMGTLAELSLYEKPTIIIPLPDSPQEKNARFFADRHAAVLLQQKECTPDIFSQRILSLLSDSEAQKKLSEHIASIFFPNAAQRVVDVILSLI